MVLAELVVLSDESPLQPEKVQTTTIDISMPADVLWYMKVRTHGFKLSMYTHCCPQ